MKPRKSRVPDWFDLENYRRVQSWEDWSYGVWVRSHYYGPIQSGKNREFVTYSLDGPNKAHRLLSQAIPVSSEYFVQFLSNNSLFWEDFCEIKRFWWAEGEGNAVRVHDFDEILPTKVIYDFPDLIEKGVALGLNERWFECEQPISINYACSIEKIMSDVYEHVTQQQEFQTGRFVAAGVVASMEKMRTHVFKGAKILALFDLLYWKEVHPELTYAEIGEAIWRGEGLNIDQRIKKVGIPAMDQFFTLPMAKALFLEHAKRVEADLLGKN